MMLRKPLAATAIAALTGLALAGCTPPNQKDSDIKVDTATSVEAPAPATSSAVMESSVMGETVIEESPVDETVVVESEVAPVQAPAS